MNIVVMPGVIQRLKLLTLSSVILLCSWIQGGLLGQCDQGPPPGPDCVQAVPLCGELLCFTTDDNPNNGEPVQWCGVNTAVHNPQYFTFIADSTVIHFEISVDTCLTNGCGLQCAIIDTCSGGMPPWTVDNVLACDPGAPSGAVMVLHYENAEPGKMYWLMIDGCAGDLCQYSFTSGVGVIFDSPVVTIDTVVCGGEFLYDGTVYLPGEYIVYQGDSVTCDTIVAISVTDLFQVSLNDVTVCADGADSVLFVPLVQGYSGGYTYLWNDGDTVEAHWAYDVIPGDTISVVVADSSGCIETSYSVVGEGGTVVASFETGIVTDSFVTFINLSENATSYFWDFGDGDTSNVAHPLHEFDTSGTYLITLVARGLCNTDTMQLSLMVTVTSTFDGLSVSTMSIVPNPNDGNFHLLLDNPSEGCDLAIYDLHGRDVIPWRRLMEPELDGPIRLNVLKPGVYLVAVRWGSEAAICKMVVTGQ